MCNLELKGTLGIVDMAKCPYEFGSPEFLNFHLKDLSTIEQPIKRIRYEEEIVVELDEKKTKVLTEYGAFIRQVEGLLLRKDIYGLKQDEQHSKRRTTMRKFFELLFMSPLMAHRLLDEYKEPYPERSAFLKGYQTFKAWVNGILKRYGETKLYKLTKETKDLRMTFLSLAGLKSLYFIESLVLGIPKKAKPLKEEGGRYELPFGVIAQIYDLPGEDAYLYVQENPQVKNLPKELSKMMKNLILGQMKESFEAKNFDIIFSLKAREYRQYFMDEAIKKGIDITPQQALAMGREVSAWVVGLGADIENLSLDKEHVTDIYIDSENCPLYIEHSKFGLCHTLYRYNRELLERGFKNIVLSQKGKKFDDKNPVVDVVVKRLSMRAHLQRPPATFAELQGALRIMKEEPFTYAQYLYYNSFTPFFTGYDDVMVGLGCSEAVLGLKGVGKTAFTAAKISAIGTKKRIIPIQDIQEIPVKAFRKRGFHIGAARVTSAVEGEGKGEGEMDLVAMANALLRMGDAALIINEIRSRLAVQGVINLLNTQPGVFLLYNLHAESLRDIQDRLELVFGIPGASMYATDRYTFLKKVKFGRRGRTHRVLGYEFETDQEKKQFVEIFKFKRGSNIENCTIEPKFLRNPEGIERNYRKVNVGKLQKELDLEFIPPVLERRTRETGIAPEEYILQAFFKGKMYHEIYQTSMDVGDPLLRELDFVMKINSMTNKMIAELENENGKVDYIRIEKEWPERYKEILKKELEIRKAKKG
ncbi:Flp pilus assembly complex ATPase component TadA [Candidatus Micrarchaeota archaeon]|nr:Flp pilus assembly complex ATPase component TadA [Candidatus Micrarchaeota archaeon]